MNVFYFINNKTSDDNNCQLFQFKLDSVQLSKLSAQSPFFRNLATTLNCGDTISLKNLSKRVFDHIYKYCDLTHLAESSSCSDKSSVKQYIYKLVKSDTNLDFSDFIQTCEFFQFNELLQIFR